MISVLVLPLVVQSQFDTFVARVGMEAMGLDNPATSSPQETIQPQLMEDSNQISNPGNLVLAQVKTGITSQRAVAQLKRQLSQATEDEAKKSPCHPNASNFSSACPDEGKERSCSESATQGIGNASVGPESAATGSSSGPKPETHVQQ
jgi:hypothetical protein